MLPAHLTFFHQLSSAQTARLSGLAAPAGPVPILCDGLLQLGFGVAVRVASSELARLRAAVRDVMGGEFSHQDSQTWQPHVTIQNKVPADAAQRLHRELANKFAVRAGAVTGLLVWEYLNGPWKQVDRLPFA
ncbi:2'-5' RNA ligase family protein [Bradyrhizobium sp. McL0616]|uniref:2'-5' RNA ligase family protein n=1 Tax=Bradyrhizobium sp. McL0616 TaxID=3415674 RepID=UPI003CEBB845